MLVLEVTAIIVTKMIKKQFNWKESRGHLYWVQYEISVDWYSSCQLNFFLQKFAQFTLFQDTMSFQYNKNIRADVKADVNNYMDENRNSHLIQSK